MQLVELLFKNQRGFFNDEEFLYFVIADLKGSKYQQQFLAVYSTYFPNEKFEVDEEIFCDFPKSKIAKNFAKKHLIQTQPSRAKYI